MNVNSSQYLSPRGQSGLVELTMPSGHRPRVFAKQTSSRWKEKIREECRRRAREQRQFWLNRYRASEDRNREKEAISSEMRGIVDGAIVAENFGSMGMSTDDCLFHKDIASRCSYADSEYEDLVKEFEEMLMADFMGYSQLKSEIDIEMMRDLQDLEDICQKGQSGNESSAESLLCPVCNQAFLQVDQWTVSCPLDRFRIDLSFEGIGIEMLRDRLCETYIDHKSVCMGTLKYSVDSQFGPPVLCAQCEDCSILQVVARGVESSLIDHSDIPHETPCETSEESDFAEELQDLSPSVIFEILDQLYAPYPQSVFKELSKEHMREAKGVKKSLVYGELTFASSCFVLTEALRHSSASSITFYDLGSGSGKQVLTAALHEPRVTVAKGIEIIPEMHEIACAAQARLESEFLPAFNYSQKTVQFICADIFQTDWSDADVILLNSTCFTRNMLCTLEENGLQALKPGSVIITLSKKLSHSEFCEVAMHERRMSWGTTQVNFYCRI